MAGREPRTIKRFVNIYPIIRARFDAAQSAEFFGSEGRTAVYPIVAVLVATETGQALEVAQTLHKLLESHPGALPPQILQAPLQPACAVALQKRSAAEIIRNECRPWPILVQRYCSDRYD